MNIKALKQEQLELAKHIVINNKLTKVKLVAGCDVIGTADDTLICCIALVDYKTLKLVDSVVTTAKAPIKYIPGFLGFREGPIIVNTFISLKQKPDVLLVKGHGIAHPRKMGIASQLGLQLDTPTIGVATKLLTGKTKDGKIVIEGKVRGAEVHTKEYAKPIYVSPGHLVSLAKSIEIVKNTTKQPHKLPEPIFIAHKLAKKFKKKMEANE